MVDVPPEDCIAAIVNMRPGVLVIFFRLWIMVHLKLQLQTCFIICNLHLQVGNDEEKDWVMGMQEKQLSRRIAQLNECRL